MKQTLIAVLVLVVIIALVLLFAGRNDEETLPVEETPVEDVLPTEDLPADDETATDTDDVIEGDLDVSVDGETEVE